MNHKYLIDYITYVSYNALVDECAVFDIEYDFERIIIVFGGNYKGRDWRNIVEIIDQPDYETYNEDGKFLIRELAKEAVKQFNHLLVKPDR